MSAAHNVSQDIQGIAPDILLTFKEAMNYLRVSRSTLYRLMWAGQLTGHKVGSTWRFYRSDLQASIRTTSIQSTEQENDSTSSEDQALMLIAASR
jgi:excisionase family DNA binding protein